VAIPQSKDARLYYRCALQRYEDAQMLLEADRTTGAVYLAGYGVECILKALILSALAPAPRADMLRTFRGPRAHEYEWLRTQYLENGGARFPPEVNKKFTLVNVWSIELRYTPSTTRLKEAEGFLAAAKIIIHWADGRL
jgi:HEPN domain-containing protein